MVAARLSGLTQLTLIDLLFLLAPLVIAPLGLRLIAFDAVAASRLLAAAVWMQPIGAALATVSFLLPIGGAAAVLASIRLLVCAIAALGALADLIDGRSLRPVRLAPAAAVGFMAFGAIWLVLSRAGIAPLGLSPSSWSSPPCTSTSPALRPP
jgi:YndJ-like protein